MSSESVATEINQTLLPKCYANLCDEDFGDEGPLLLPTYIKVLAMLRLTTMSHKTACNWLQFLEFKYDKVKRCYYTDGHQRSDVLYDREERFLPKYFKYEVRAH
eukprot:scaffold26027_cov70-Attheya_sp.AAC.12